MNPSLQDFISSVRSAGRIRFADMRRLQRDVLPARLTTCEQAEALIALDRELQSTDPDWRDYLVLLVRDFIVWGMEPIGSVDRAKAEWLVPILSPHDGMTKTGRLIAREVVREAWEADEILAALAPRSPKRRRRDEDEHDLQIEVPEPARPYLPRALLPAPSRLLRGYTHAPPCQSSRV
jgi:hypothetical protein